MFSIHIEYIYENSIENKAINPNKEVAVLRINNKDYIGFYQHFINKNEDLLATYNSSSLTPEPARDGVLSLQYMNENYREKSEKYIFGYSNEEQLYNWLSAENGFIEDLKKENLFITTFKFNFNVKEKE